MPICFHTLWSQNILGFKFIIFVPTMFENNICRAKTGSSWGTVTLQRSCALQRMDYLALLLLLLVNEQPAKHSLLFQVSYLWKFRRQVKQKINKEFKLIKELNLIDCLQWTTCQVLINIENYWGAPEIVFGPRKATGQFWPTHVDFHTTLGTCVQKYVFFNLCHLYATFSATCAS